MTDKEKNSLMKKASEFNGPNDAFIHSEMKNSETQQVVSGNPTGIVHACYVALRRCAQLTGITYNDIINIFIDDFELSENIKFSRTKLDNWDHEDPD